MSDVDTLYYPPPAGCHWEWKPEAEDWRIDEGRPCRRMMADHVICRQPSVAALNRSAWKGGSNWWAYCADHLYGRKIEDGVVLHRVAVPSESGEHGGSV